MEMVRSAILLAAVALVMALHSAHANGGEKEKYDKCLADKKCDVASCGGVCTGDNWHFCLAMCKLNCNCSCLDKPAAGKLDGFEKWQKCATEKKCEVNHGTCKSKCKDKACRDACVLEQDKCLCDCNK